MWSKACNYRFVRLHEFLIQNLDQVLATVRKKFLEGTDRAQFADDDGGRVELFLRQLIETLRNDVAEAAPGNPEIRASAAKHGADLLKQGFTVAQVVHGYGSICQAVTELAVELQAAITTSEFRTLNQCLDAAIAEAVTEYSRQRDRNASEQNTRQLGFLAHELRNLLMSAQLSFEVLEKGQVGIAGNTGAVLRRSLLGLGNLIDRTLSSVRLEAGIQRREPIRVAELVEEAEASAIMEAKARAIRLAVTPGAYDVFVEGDRHLMASALSNLLQNGIKFSPRGSIVRLGARIVDERVLVEVADHCCGLPGGRTEELFRPFLQGHEAGEGLGLGLSIARQSVEVNGGILRARDLPGQGCVFTIDLPAFDLKPPRPR